MRLILAIICLVSMAFCPDRDTERQKELKTLPKEVKQVILVQNHRLSLWNRTDGKGDVWEKAFEVECQYGKNGLKADRHEGDGTTPIGLFKVLYAFGNAPDPGSALPYKPITKTSYWSGEKEDYNTWVEVEPGTRDMSHSEHLSRYKVCYKYSMAIDFNTNPVVYGKGSAIFIHVQYPGDETTIGCVTVSEEYMLRLLKECGEGTYLWVK